MRDLDAFVTWLRRRGRSADTAALYRRHLAVALDDPTARLLDRKLAPKTRRVVKAALKSWAKYKSDGELLALIDDVKLPSPVRKAPRLPLPREQWEQYIDFISTPTDACNEAERAVLLLIATRGFRVGDVLRLERGEVEGALASGTLTLVAKGERRLEYRARPIAKYLRILAGHDDWDCVRDLISPDARGARRQTTAVLRIERALQRTSAAAGLDPTTMYPHRLRRTYAVEFLRLQTGPEGMGKLMKVMQWSSIATAAGYVDYVSEEALASAEDAVFSKKR